MRHLTMCLLILTGCDTADPVIEATSGRVVGTFQYNERTCRLVEVRQQQFGHWYVAARFVDCGEGPVSASFPGNKGRLQ